MIVIAVRIAKHRIPHLRAKNLEKKNGRRDGGGQGECEGEGEETL
jgi:hypothetical protein